MAKKSAVDSVNRVEAMQSDVLLYLSRELIGAMAGRLAVILPEEEQMLKELDALLDRIRSPF